MSAPYLGDFPEDFTGLTFYWSSNAIAGESITRATNGTISVYKDGGTTQSTAGITDTEDFDSLTGVHKVLIDTSADAFYAAGSEYAVILSAATIDGKTINAPLAHFSIERANGVLALLKGGTNGLAAIKTAIVAVDDFVDTEIADIQSRLPAALVGGRMDANVGAISADATAADNLEAALDGTGGVTITAALTGNVTGNLSGSVGSVTGNVGGNVTGTIGGLTAAALKDFFDTDSTTTYASAVAGSVVKEIADNAGGASLTVQDIVDGVWDEPTAGHTTAGTTGKALTDAGSAGDPWSTALPGAYGAGTAGKIIGDNINATVSSRASQASVDTIDDFLDTEVAAILAAVDTEVAAILADTNELQTDWANGGRLDLILDARASQTSVDTVDDFLDTEVAAIKAKTDQLTFTTANQVDSTAVTVSDKTGYALTADFRIKKNTALANFMFPLVDSTDHVTPKTGLTVTATRSLDGAAFAACANAVTELSNGVYKISLAAGDLNGDVVTLRFTATGGDDRLITIITQTE